MTADEPASAGTPPIVVEYVFSPQDLGDIVRGRDNANGWGGLKGAARLFAMMAGLLAVMFLVMTVGFRGVRDPGRLLALAVTIAPAFAAIALVAALAPMLLRPLMVRYYWFGQVAIANLPVRYVLTDDGLAYDNPKASGLLRWAAVDRIVEVPDAFILLISRLEGIAVPRRALPPADYARALAYARQRTLAARS